MKRGQTQNISDVLREYMKENRMDQKLMEVRLVNSWEQLIGKTIAKYTSRVQVKDGRFIIYTRSATVRNELLMIRSGLIKRLNEEAGEEIIREVIVR